MKTVWEHLARALKKPELRVRNTGASHGSVHIEDFGKPSCKVIVYVEWTGMEELIYTLSEEYSHIEIMKAYLHPRVGVRVGDASQRGIDWVFEWLWPPSRIVSDDDNEATADNKGEKCPLGECDGTPKWIEEVGRWCYEYYDCYTKEDGE